MYEFFCGRANFIAVEDSAGRSKSIQSEQLSVSFSIICVTDKQKNVFIFRDQRFGRDFLLKITVSKQT